MGSPSVDSQRYYALKRPRKFPDNVNPSEEFVYTHHAIAHEMMKKLKGARLKIFADFADAVKWSRSDEQTTLKKVEKIDAERSPFPSINPQNMGAFKRLLEADLVDEMTALIMKNPRYLIGDADTPTIVMAGPRYNSVHICCRNNAHRCLMKIFQSINDVEFIKKLYPFDKSDSVCRRRDYLFDHYLNTPEKVIFETPLHLASKFGFGKCVSLLLQYPNCDRDRLNKYGFKATDLINKHVSSLSSSLRSQCWSSDSLRALFDKNCYIVVKRDECKVGLSKHVSKLPDDESIQAVAGPMSPSIAEKFYSTYRSPRQLSPADAHIRLTDASKGIERLLRNECRKSGLTWSEYWPFLDCFCDLASEEGLSKLEKHLRKKQLKIEIEQESSRLANESLQSEFDKSIGGDTSSSLIYQSSFSPHSPVSADNHRLSTSYDPSVFMSPISQLCQEFMQLKLSSNDDSFAKDSTKDIDDKEIESILEKSFNRSENLSGFDLQLIDYESDDDASDCDEYLTPPESPTFYAWCFVNGSKLTDCDRNAAIALSNTEVDRYRYPYVHNWLKRVRDEPGFRDRLLTPNANTTTEFRYPLTPVHIRTKLTRKNLSFTS